MTYRALFARTFVRFTRFQKARCLDGVEKFTRILFFYCVILLLRLLGIYFGVGYSFIIHSFILFIIIICDPTPFIIRSCTDLY